MWEQYKRTVSRIQIMIALATLGIYFGLNHRVVVAATFFAVMQLGALVGAWWGQRLRRRLGPLYL